jgi:hypothetical protein
MLPKPGSGLVSNGILLSDLPCMGLLGEFSIYIIPSNEKR